MPLIYLDIETDNSEGYNGLDVFNGRIVTIQMLLPNGQVIILKDPIQKDMDEIKPILESNLIIGHNLKFDCRFIKQKFGVTIRDVYDTYIAEIVISGGMYANTEYRRVNKIGLGLKDLVFRYCGKHLNKEEQSSFKYGVDLTPEQIEYARQDLVYLPTIHKQQMAKIKSLGLESTIDTEMKVLPAIVWLELSGFKVDPEKIEDVRSKIELQLIEAKAYLISALQPLCDKPLNLNSTRQLQDALKKKNYILETTGEDDLIKYAGDELIDHLLKYRYANKFLTTYIASAHEKIGTNGKITKGYIYPDGRTYTTFNQYGTETGRLSCSKNNISKLPIQSLNFQTQPKRENWRDVFVAEKGCKLITADYSQIEPRIMAQVGNDSKMIEAYRSGKDLYKLTASAIFGIPYEQVKKESREREISKQITLGLCYGMGSFGLIRKLKTESNIELTQSEAEIYISKFKKSYPQVTAFLYNVGRNAVKSNMVRNKAGRIRQFQPAKNSKERFSIERQAKNAVIQSLSADMTKIAMINLFGILEPMGVKFCTTVHDELVFEVKEEHADEVARIVKDEMLKAAKIFLTDVPCDASITVDAKWQK